MTLRMPEISREFGSPNSLDRKLIEKARLSETGGLAIHRAERQPKREGRRKRPGFRGVVIGPKGYLARQDWTVAVNFS